MTKLDLNTRVIRRPDELGELKLFLDTTPIFGLDIETTVVDKVFDRHIRTIQIGNREIQFVIDLKHFSNGDILNQGFCKTPDWALPLKELFDPYFLSNKSLKVGHNLSFEYETFIWCLGIKFYGLYDTYISELVLNAGKVKYTTSGYFGLDDVAKKRCNFVMDKELQTSFNLDDELTDDQIYYAALDTRVPLAVRLSQLKEIERFGLQNVIQIENDAVPYFSDLHVNGFYLDKDKWLDTLKFYEEKHRRNIEELDKHFIPIVGPKLSKEDIESFVNKVSNAEASWRFETRDKVLRAELRKRYQDLNREFKSYVKDAEGYEGQAAINYGSPDQMLNALRKSGIKLPDTNDNTLNLIDKPIIKAVQNYRETLKVLSTYGNNWLDYINSKTGLVHSRFWQIGSETGRTSSTGPNCQNIRNAESGEPDHHHCFTARSKDRTLAIVDMSGAELRLITEMSGEKLWVDAFAKGWDVHSIGAELIFPKEWTEGTEPGCKYLEKKAKCSCVVHKKLRGWVKSINFGIAYGMMARKLSQELGIPEEEAQTLLDSWCLTFKEIVAYLTKSGTDAKAELMSRTITGRIRWFNKPDVDVARNRLLKDQIKYEKKGKTFNVTSQRVRSKLVGMYAAIEREGKNSPIQGSNIDIAKLAAGCGYDKNGNPFLWHLLQQYDALNVNFVHDEFVIDCPIEHAEKVKEIVMDAIRRAGAEYMSKVVMEAEGVVSFIWKK